MAGVIAALHVALGVLSVACGLLLVADAVQRVRLGDLNWKHGRSWRRFAAVAAVAAATGSAWCWPAVVVEAVCASEELDPTHTDAAWWPIVQWGAFTLSVVLSLAAAVAGVRGGAALLFPPLSP